jgi:hypothetical protein
MPTSVGTLPLKSIRAAGEMSTAEIPETALSPHRAANHSPWPPDHGPGRNRTPNRPNRRPVPAKGATCAMGEQMRPRAARQKRRAAPLGNGPSIVAPRKLAGALEFLPSERSLCAKFLRGGNNPGLFDHAGRKTMRHWITSFRLVDDTGMLR